MVSQWRSRHLGLVRVISGVLLHETFRVASTDKSLMCIQKERASDGRVIATPWANSISTTLRRQLANLYCGAVTSLVPICKRGSEKEVLSIGGQFAEKFTARDHNDRKRSSPWLSKSVCAMVLEAWSAPRASHGTGLEH